MLGEGDIETVDQTQIVAVFPGRQCQRLERVPYERGGGEVLQLPIHQIAFHLPGPVQSPQSRKDFGIKVSWNVDYLLEDPFTYEPSQPCVN
jgi:hypothetical protein